MKTFSNRPSSPSPQASVFFLFFAALAPAVAFGAVLTSATAGMLGATEVILATAIGGVMYAVLCGQPHVHPRSTGSVVTYTAILYTTCAQYGLPFFGTYAWIGIWTSILLMIVAVTSSSNLVRFFTKFTDETFAAARRCIFCAESAKKIIMMFFNPSISSTLAMGSALTALVTCGSAIAISNFKRSPYGPEGVRNLIGDFGAHLRHRHRLRLRRVARGGHHGFTFDALSLPASLAPSIARPLDYRHHGCPDLGEARGSRACPRVRDPPVHGPEHHHPSRERLQGSQEARCLPPRHVLALPHHRGHLHLRSPLDLCVHRALPHPAKSLTDVKQDPATGFSQEVTGVTETRWTPLVLNLLIGASIIFLKDILGQIPMCVLSGIFFYLGLAAMRERVH